MRASLAAPHSAYQYSACIRVSMLRYGTDQIDKTETWHGMRANDIHPLK